MKPQPNRLFLSVLILILFVTGVAAVIAERRPSSPKKSSTSLTTSRSPARTGYPDRIPASRLRPQVRVLLDGLGNRLSTRGMERVTLVGTLNRAGASQPVVVVHEFPHLLLVTGNNGALVSFNARVARAGQTLNGEARALVEALFYDSAESFFIAQWRGAATRFLGGRASAAEGGDGPVYDIYEVTDDDAARGAGQPRSKRYFFNSDTQLLEIVRYESERDGQSISVETRFGDWRKVRGQHVPGNVTRLENGQVVLSFANGSTALGPREPAVKETPKLNAV